MRLRIFDFFPIIIAKNRSGEINETKTSCHLKSLSPKQYDRKDIDHQPVSPIFQNGPGS
jgi:hypothetical protein